MGPSSDLEQSHFSFEQLNEAQSGQLQKLCEPPIIPVSSDGTLNKREETSAWSVLVESPDRVQSLCSRRFAVIRSSSPNPNPYASKKKNGSEKDNGP